MTATKSFYREALRKMGAERLHEIANFVPVNATDAEITKLAQREIERRKRAFTWKQKPS